MVGAISMKILGPTHVSLAILGHSIIGSHLNECDRALIIALLPGKYPARRICVRYDT